MFVLGLMVFILSRLRFKNRLKLRDLCVPLYRIFLYNPHFSRSSTLNVTQGVNVNARQHEMNGVVLGGLAFLCLDDRRIVLRMLKVDK